MSKLSLGEYLRKIRRAKKISLRTAAEDFGCTYQFVYALEKDKAVPPIGMIKQMAKAYNVADKEIRAKVVEYLIAKIRRKYQVFS